MLQSAFGLTSFLCLLFLFCAPAATAQPVIKVPRGEHVMIDGRCEPNEWRDATMVRATDNYEIFLKKTSAYVFVCASSQRAMNLMLDFYVAVPDKPPRTLHASAKLGERTLTGERWQEFTNDWNWWQIDGWTASILRVNSFQGPTFMPTKGIEFQIDRRVFRGREWRVMFYFLSDNTIFPVRADNLKTDGWIKLKF